jgi:hypothetical protein
VPAETFRVRVVGAQLWDAVTDNVDVEVTLADGRRFGATFFTVQNIQKLFDKNRATGECAGGLYLWAANMILVERISVDVIERTVEELLGTDEFFSVFSLLSNS